ncbi:MAG: PEP-CTERM sorting domain-containing protein [Phycisphaerae bacterium]|nr:PEP-CTERM sorting domain-containing protein [Phycisphaerae bacterium]
MFKRKAILAIVAFAAVVASSSSVFASAWPVNASGTNTAFGWTSGEHLDFVPDSTAFGSPAVDELGFFFRNDYGDMYFRAEQGGPNTVHGSVDFEFDIAGSNPGGAGPISQIIFRERGTWGGNLADIQIQYDFSMFSASQLLLIAPESIFADFNMDGTWEAEYILTPAGATALNQFFAPIFGFENAQIQITNILHVSGSNPDTFVQKTYSSVIFPEPGTIGLLAVLGGVALIRRRR